MIHDFFPSFGTADTDPRTEALAMLLADFPRAHKPPVLQDLVKFWANAIETSARLREILPDMRTAILRQSDRIFARWAEHLEQSLAALLQVRNPPREISLVSLGCGSGAMETRIFGSLAARFPQTRLTWCGADHAGPDSDCVFFRPGNVFAQCDAHAMADLPARLGIAAPMVILMNFSLHHFPVAHESFLRAMRKHGPVILIEEPVTRDQWADADFRLLRLGLEVVGNCALHANWREMFTSEPGSFHTQFLTFESLSAMGGEIEVLEDTDPRTAIVRLPALPQSGPL